MLTFLDLNLVESKPWSCQVICANWSKGIPREELSQFRSYCDQHNCRPQVAQLGQRVRHAAGKCDCFKSECVVEVLSGEKEADKEVREECDSSLVSVEKAVYEPMTGFISYPHEIDESELVEFRKCLDKRVSTQGKKLGIYDPGSMGYFNRQHFEIYAQLLGSLSPKHSYYIPGDGDGIMSYLMWKRSYKYYSVEPSSLGENLKRVGLLGVGSYDPEFEADVVLYLNVLGDFLPSSTHMKKRFIILDDVARAVPDWLCSFYVFGTGLRLYSNFAMVRLPFLAFSYKVCIRVMKLAVNSINPVDVRHRLLCEEFGVPFDCEGVPVGENVYDLLNGQDHFSPNSIGVFFGRRGDYFVVEGMRHEFIYGKKAVPVAHGVIRVECSARKRVIYRIESRDGCLSVRLTRYKPYVYGRMGRGAQILLWEVVKGEGPYYRVREQHTMKYLDWMYGKTWFGKVD